jgi:hypothetical protein
MGYYEATNAFIKRQSLAAGRSIPPLDARLGQHIRTICSASIVNDPAQNHCTHFVAHMLGYTLGVTCNTIAAADRQLQGASIRVNELFNATEFRWPWNVGDLVEGACLAFATIRSNVNEPPYGKPIMGSNGHKHVGIYSAGCVWHYSTASGKVRRDPPERFKAYMRSAYGPDTVFFASGLGVRG